MTSIPPQIKKRAPDSEVYRDFVEAKKNSWPTGDILLKHHISRRTLYNIVDRVRHGSAARINKDVKDATLTATWEHRYKERFFALPKNRNAATIKELRSIIRGMSEDGFSPSQTARYLKKHHTTIIHHLT